MAHWVLATDCTLATGNAVKLPHRRRFLRLAAGAAVLPAVTRIATAQAYPSRPVRIVVGFPAGISPDIIARLMAQRLSERLGQQFIVENRPGAASNIATEIAVKAPSDGYTLLMVAATNTINATLYTNLNFDFIRDIGPVASIAGTPFVMLVNQSFPPRLFPSSLPMPKPIRARSTWPLPARGAIRMSWASCSRQ